MVCVVGAWVPSLKESVLFTFLSNNSIIDVLENLDWKRFQDWKCGCFLCFRALDDSIGLHMKE